MKFLQFLFWYLIAGPIKGGDSAVSSLVFLVPIDASTGIFQGLIWGRISAPSPFKNEKKLSKMVNIIPNFLVLHFGENLMKIQTKIAKLQMPENLHKNVNENSFLFTFSCKLSEFL